MSPSRRGFSYFQPLERFHKAGGKWRITGKNGGQVATERLGDGVGEEAIESLGGADEQQEQAHCEEFIEIDNTEEVATGYLLEIDINAGSVSDEEGVKARRRRSGYVKG